MKTTPTQSAIIQFVESLLITAIIAGLYNISMLPATGTVSLQQVVASFGLAVLVSLAHSLTAYLKALPTASTGQDYSALGTALDAAFVRFLPQITSVITPAQPVAQPHVVVVTQTPATISTPTVSTSTPLQGSTSVGSVALPPIPMPTQNNTTTGVPPVSTFSYATDVVSSTTGPIGVVGVPKQ